MATQLHTAAPGTSLDHRPVLFIIGLLITTLGIVMLVPAGIDFFTPPIGPVEAFAPAAAVSTGVGGMLLAANRGTPGPLTRSPSLCPDVPGSPCRP